MLKEINCKIRFAMSRLPYFPVTYRLVESDGSKSNIAWTKVMPFFDKKKSLFNFELWGWDVPELRFLKKILVPGMVFFDVGAYHGIYSIVAASSVGLEGKVYAFEPNPKDFNRILNHIKLNKLSNIIPENIALSDTDGTALFHVPVNGVMTVGSLRPSTISKGQLKAIQVKSNSLDSYASNNDIENIDLIKVDVEGAEMLFLDGAKSTIHKFKPLMIVEAIDVVCHPWGYSGADFLNRIQSEFDYLLYSFCDDGKLQPHHVVDTYPLDSRCNFLAVPLGKVNLLKSVVR